MRKRAMNTLDAYETELKNALADETVATGEEMKLWFQRVLDDNHIAELETFDCLVSRQALSGPTPPDIFGLISTAIEKHGAKNARIVVSREVRVYMDLQAIRNKTVWIEPPDGLDIETDELCPTGRFKGIPIYIFDPLD